MADDSRLRAGHTATEAGVLAGDTDNLPAQDTRVIQVFVSSTFTDYAVERNFLMCSAFKRLRDYCSTIGYDFQIADMRWGVRDEAQNDHQTTEVCLEAVSHSRRVSRGPYFLLLLGDRYGYRPYPNVIEAGEYESLHQVAVSLGVDVKLLDEWFQKDTNEVPVSYVLQPITSKFPYYNDETDVNKELHDKEVSEWNAVDRLLTSILRAAADGAYQRNMISEKAKFQYFLSVTEQEVHHGILDVDDIKDRVLVAKREIKDINIKDKLAKRFCDLEAGERDTEAQALLRELGDEKIPQKLHGDDIHCYTIEWDERGVSSGNEQHASYLQQFDVDVETSLKTCIERSLEKERQWKSNHDLYKDVLHHAAFCYQKQVCFHGREELLKDVKEKLMKTWNSADSGEDAGLSEAQESEAEPEAEYTGETQEERIRQEELLHAEMGIHYVVEPADDGIDAASLHQLYEYRPPAIGTKPLVIYGKSGSGKTAFIAKLHTEISKWIEKPRVKVIRFLGTSSKCMDLRTALLNVCAQIEFNYGIRASHDVRQDQELVTLSAYFLHLLQEIDSKSKPLILLLDSLDQLEQDNADSHSLWIPQLLPRNVYLIVSVMAEENKLLSALRSVVGDETRFVEMKPLSETSARTVLDLWKEHYKHNLTEEQTSYIMDRYADSGQALWLQLAFARSLWWKSYTPRPEWYLSVVTNDVINALFERCEHVHGEIIVSHALGYMTASRNGTSHGEMEDLLSCDDEVLQDTYLYHLPADENNIRLPPLLWQRICSNLSIFLVERIADGKSLISWYHRQFHSVAKARYVDTDRFEKIHSSIADYFLGKWSDAVKPLELYKRKKATFPNAMRQVPPQPLMYGEQLFNLRKLNLLPYHLSWSGRYAEVLEHCCTFEWIYVKVLAVGILAVLADIDLILDKLFATGTKERDESCRNAVDHLTFLKQLLLLRRDVVIRDPHQLPIQLLGQMIGRELPASFAAMVDHIKAKLHEIKLPYVVPSTYCLPYPGSDVTAVFDVDIAHPGDPHRLESKCCLSQDGRYLYVVERQKKEGDLLKVFDIAAHGLLKAFFSLRGRMVKRLTLVGGDSYFLLDLYPRHRDEYGETHCELLTSSMQVPSFLPRDATAHAISDAGDWVIFTPETGKKAVLMHVASGKQIDVYFENDTTGTEKTDPLGVPRNKKATHVRRALFSQDASFVVVFTAKLEALVIEVSSGTVKHEWNMGKSLWSFDTESEIESVRLKNDIVLCTGMSYDTRSTLYMLDIKKGIQHELLGHEYEISIIRINKSQTRAVTGTTDTGSSSNKGEKSVIVWDLEKRQLISRCGFGIHRRRVGNIYTALEFAGAQDEFILTCQTLAEPTICVWYIGVDGQPLAEAVLIYELIGHTNDVMFLHLTDGGRMLVSASVDNTVMLWNMESVVQRCEKLVEESEDLNAFNTAKAEEAPNKPGEGMIMTTAMTISPDGKIAAVGTHNGWLIFYDIENCVMKSAQRIYEEKVTSIITSSSGKYVITATSCTQVWNPQTGECHKKLEFDTGYGAGHGSTTPSCLAENNDVVVAGYGGMSCFGVVWNIISGDQICVLKGLYGFEQVAITSNASAVVSTMFDYPLIYRIPSGECEMKQPDTMMAGCTVIVISADDRYVAAGSSDGSVRILTVQDEKYLYRMQHHSTVSQATFSPDSRHLLTASFRNINIWSMSDGNLSWTLTYHQAFVTKMMFACGDRFLVSSSHDKCINIFDYHNRIKVTSFCANSPIKDIVVASNLSSILFAPENISYIGVLNPNKCLQHLVGGGSVAVSKQMQNAQALAFALSPQQVKKATSQSCIIL